MTIDEAIRYYECKNVVLTEEEALANAIATETMRKYQKICEILDKSDNGEQCMYDTIQDIEEVRDGYDD